MIATSVIELKKEDLHLARKIKSYYSQNLSYGWKSNTNKSYDHGHWNKEILINSKLFPIDLANTAYLNCHSEISDLWSIISNALGSERGFYRAYINGYTYGTDAYAHTDDPWMRNNGEDNFSETSILYLNESWNKDFAGETVIFNEEDEIESSVLPKFGRILIFDSSKFHAARPLTRMCGELRLVFVIKTFDKKLESKEANFILEFARDKKHKEKSFFEHLFNTALISERSKCSKEIVAASLFHSVYETEFYKFEGEKPTRETVRALIGDYAEELVHEFCSLTDRFETIVENKKNYEPKMQKDLATIELSNLFEQNTNGKYNEKLVELKKIVTLIEK